MGEKLPNTLVGKIKNLNKIHGVDEKQIEKFIDAIEIEKYIGNDEIKIADLFCGTDILIKEALRDLTHKKIYVYLVDMDDELLRAASSNLRTSLIHHKNIKIYPSNILLNGKLLSYNDNSMDIVVVKMGLHETTLESQQRIINDVYRCLRKGGRLVIWDVFVPRDSKTNEDIIGYNRIIKLKDELSGVSHVTKNRYFASEEEFIGMMKKVQFQDIKLVHRWKRIWDTLDRLEGEFGGDLNKVHKRNVLIDSYFNTQEYKRKFSYKITKRNGIEGRSFEIPSGIIRAIKDY